MNNAVIGLTWAPKLSSLASGAKAIGSRNVEKSPAENLVIRHETQLVDGLFVPSNDPRKLNKLAKMQRKDTTGSDWFDMPAPVITPEIKKDLQLLKLRSVMDPKRHYKKVDTKSKALPKYFQVGTVIEPPLERYNRLTKKERKQTLAEELLSDSHLEQYRKRKVREIEERNRPAGNPKWKHKSHQTYKTKKQRRH